MFSILCMHFFIAYQNYVLSETRAIDVNHRFLVIESNFCRYYGACRRQNRYNPSTITKEDVNWNKKSNIKMLKMALFDCAINEKCCSIDGGRGICRLFSSPPLGICHPRQNREGGGGGGGWLNSPLYDLKASHSLLRSSKFFTKIWFKYTVF